MSDAPPHAPSHDRRPPDPGAPQVAAIVLCGGASRRFGGGDKTAALLGDESLLARLVTGLPPAWAVVCVGAERPLPRQVTWTREDPPGGGPVAGLAAGLRAAPTTTSVAVVLAGDQPFAAPAARELADRLGRAVSTAGPEHDDGADDGGADVDGLAARQPDGRAQLLLAAYRASSLRRVLAGREVRDRGVHATLRGLRVAAVDLGAASTLDVDTAADLARAAALEPGHADPLRPRRPAGTTPHPPES